VKAEGALLLRAAAALIAAALLPAAAARPFAPAYVYSMGGKFDRSFNQSLYDGAEKLRRETGVAYVDFEVTHETQLEQAFRHFAQRGRDPVVGVSFSSTDAVRRAARAFPNTRFILVDGDIEDMPNVMTVSFREEEGSFLVGMLAAMASKTGKVGFMGGMDIPLIRRFACGYRQGARYANPKVAVIETMAGTTPDAWTNPALGAEIAMQQFDRGADVVYAAAGATGAGALQAAADRGKFSIGVDSNQNYMHPGSVLTSMVKKVGEVATRAELAAKNGVFRPGHTVMGLKEGGVDWAYDQYNRKLITPDMKARVDQAKADIIAGRLKVHDYESDGRCGG
jgi:basic membrane protein A